MLRRIKAMLCIYKDDKFCEPESEDEKSRGRQLEVEAVAAAGGGEAGDRPRATLTKSLVVRKLFSHLTVKMGFIMCKLRVWCPDEDLAFQ